MKTIRGQKDPQMPVDLGLTEHLDGRLQIGVKAADAWVK